jgi:cytochrome c biogenesis protein CcdA
LSATGSGAAAGVVLGIVLVLLAQQLGFLGLSDLVHAIEYIVIAAVVGGVLFALFGWAMGRRYLARHPPAGSSGAPPPNS